MKKILTGIVLAGLLMGLVVPLMVSAQPIAGDAPNECCQVKRGFTWTDPNGSSVKLNKGNWIGKENGICFDSKGDTKTPVYNKGDWALACIVNTVYNITDWLFYILIVITVIFVIIGGFIIMTSSGSPEKAKTGQNFIVFALIGLVIAILARVIPAIVKYLV